MSSRTLIIAEAGVNHNGSIVLAKELIDVAAKAGADYVKFQTFKTEELVSKSAKKAEYQIKNLGTDDLSQHTMLKALELSKEAHLELIDHCKTKKIGFLSTPFDFASIELLNRLNIDLFKISSGELVNFPFLKKVALIGKPVILSTGMADLGEIEDAIDVLQEAGLAKALITVLHCNTAYPTPMEDVNLKAMLTIGNALGVTIGYSDHTLGIEVAVAAVALGAKCIEKHFTLDKNMNGPDHKCSLEPVELEDMIKAIRNIENALGDGIKKPSESEKKNKEVARKSIVASKNIKAGELFTEENLAIKRPGNGLSPKEWNNIIGKKASRDFIEDELISL